MKDYITSVEMDIARENDGYDQLLVSIRKAFGHAVEDGKTTLFRTESGDLYELFLDNLPAEARQHYNCNACRHFVNRYGGLVAISGKGVLTPVMWEITPGFFSEAVKAVRNKVKKSRVCGVFINSESYLGTPKTGSWTHMAIHYPIIMRYNNLVRTAAQEEAAKKEEHRILADALKKYKVETVETALRLLRSDSLYRSEKVLDQAEWFYDILKAAKGTGKSNMIWLAAATAPAGFCHVSSGMLGTLLDDIASGMDFDEISRRFAEKMDPLKYQRPQAAPSAGNVRRAEELVEKLGIQNSLKRRFARLDELELLWKPSKRDSLSTAQGGVFDGVKLKNKSPRARHREYADLVLPETNMTWDKFRRTVLPAARKIEFLVPYDRNSYCAICTAEDLKAPPIIQWDDVELRNPFNQYVYRNGSYPGEWNLSSGYVQVTGITLKPSMWHGENERHGKSVIFILDGCKDNRYEGSGLALFPEILKSDLHEVRATIEGYSKQNRLGGYEEASACGILLSANSKWWDYKFRVTTDLGVADYVLDRWD